jgi:hypothetical protein
MLNMDILTAVGKWCGSHGCKGHPRRRFPAVDPKVRKSKAATPRVERLVTASTWYAPRVRLPLRPKDEVYKTSISYPQTSCENRNVHAELVSLGKSPDAGTELQD